MQDIKFSSHKQYFFSLLLSTVVKEGLYRPKYTSSFLICPNVNNLQTFKSFLQCVCYRCNLLRWMLFVSCDNWKTLFSQPGLNHGNLRFSLVSRFSSWALCPKVRTLKLQIWECSFKKTVAMFFKSHKSQYDSAIFQIRYHIFVF